MSPRSSARGRKTSPGPSDDAAASNRSPVGRTARMRSTRNRRWSPARWQTRRRTTPQREEHRRRVDAAGRELVAARRPVVDLQALVVLGGSRTRRDARAHRSRRRARGARARLRASRARSRADRAGSEPGHREQRRPSGEQGETFAGVEPQRPPEVVGEADGTRRRLGVDIDVSAGEYGGTPIISTSRDLDRAARPRYRSARPPRPSAGRDGDDPRHEGEDPLRARARRAAGSSVRSRRGDRREAPAVPGLGVVEETEQNDRNAGRLQRRTRRPCEPLARRSITRSPRSATSLS